MLKDIKYTGINTASSGYDATAGQLAVAHNVINERGYIEPLSKPEKVVAYTQAAGLNGYQCVYKHEMLSGRANWIFYKKTESQGVQTDASLKFRNVISPSSVSDITLDADSPIRTQELYEITAVGNTLCVLTAGGMDYLVWKNDTYQELGTSIPNLDVVFGLKQVEKYSHDNYFTTDISVAHGDGTTPVTYNLGDGIYAQSQQVMGEISRLRGQAREEGCVDGIFFVRYALKLFDGTLVKHSSPVFMYTHDFSQVEPYVAMKSDWGTTLQTFHEFYVYYICNELYCKIASSAVISDWSDIISGIEIYITNPQSRLDMDGDITKITGSIADNYSGATWIEDHRYSAYYNSKYGLENLNTIHNIDHSDKPVKANYMHLPEKDIDISEDAVFYKVAEIGFDDIDDYSNFAKVDLSNVLETLTTQPVMTDDYHTHDIIIARGGYAYNQRINLFNVNRQVVMEQSPQTLLQYFDKSSTSYNVTVYVKMDVDGVGKWISSSIESISISSLSNIRYFFYPDTHAKEVRLIYNAGSDLTPIWMGYTLELKQHPNLNGAYWYSEDASVFEPVTIPTVGEAIYQELNKVYTSEVGNPFYFPIGGINTIGTGKILALASNVRAISQGQFGEYPLYVFTDSGIWMMEVDDKGLYKAKQPMSLDCIEPTSKVTSVDNAVAYVIKRGLMLVSSSETRCISDALDGIAEDTPNIDAIGGKTQKYNWNKYKEGAVCAYDEVNQRLHVYNPTYTFAQGENPYHFVYSVRTGLWSTEDDSELLKSTISGKYVNTDSGLLDMTFGESVPTERGQTILTRPISFETDAYKRMRDNIQRGDLDLLRTDASSSVSNIKVLLQASDDLHNWQNVGAVTKHYKIIRKSGTPHKWYRWMIVINCLPGVYRLHGLTADVEVTGNNKLR